MKRTLLGVILLGSFSSAQYFEGDVVREFGVKTGIVRAKYNSVNGSRQDNPLEDFLSVYGYLGAETTVGFTAGTSIELSTGSKMESDRTVIYSSVELNPSVELSLGDSFRVFTGFGGSINRFKERSGNLTNKDTNFGLQFFAGLKYNLFPHFGISGEYKGKIFMTGDYESNVIHHFNVGIYFLIR